MPSPELPFARPSDGVRYALSLTVDDVGRRVVVRHRLEAQAPGRPALTDALGTLTSWESGRLTVRRRDGSTVTVRESAVVAAKVVPGPAA